MVDKYSVIWAIKELEVGYFCKEHNRIHKFGTKIWERDLDHIDIDKLPVSIKKLADELQKDYDIKVKRIEQEAEQKEIIGLEKEFEKRKNQSFYLAFEITSYHGGKTTFRNIGDRDGYTSLQEMKEDIRFPMEQAKKGRNTVIIIFKATPFKIIKK